MTCPVLETAWDYNFCKKYGVIPVVRQETVERFIAILSRQTGIEIKHKPPSAAGLTIHESVYCLAARKMNSTWNQRRNRRTPSNASNSVSVEKSTA